MTTSQDSLVAKHYDLFNLGQTILAALEKAGKDPARLTVGNLAPVDQFHMGGRDATLELLRLAELRSDMKVLDVGGGLGGPARLIASRIGCQVTVLDLSEEYCRAGELLTERTGLHDKVTFQLGSAVQLPFPDGSFDAAYSQHSSMNIEDKARLYSEVGRVLRADGRFAFHEVMAGPAQPIQFPVPWAGRPDISFIRPSAEIRGLLQASGWQELTWNDVSSSSAEWWRQRLAAAERQTAPPALGLHLLMGPDAGTKAQNVLRNLDERRIEVIQAAFMTPRG